MSSKKILFSPCSEHDIRAVSLKAAHERMRQMDEKGQITIGKFGEILKEESAKIRSFGEEKAREGKCDIMTWETLKKEVAEFTKKKKIQK